MAREYGIDRVRTMENAGRCVAELAIARFLPARVAVLAGAGGNGGAGLVAARHLANRGIHVTVALTRLDLDGIAAQQLLILRRMGVVTTTEPVPVDLVVDALIGCGLDGDPIGPTVDLVTWANTQPAPLLAVDVPTGLDATLGWPATPCVTATATLTLALPKTGLLRARGEVGELYLADIGIPPGVYRRFGLEVPSMFADAGLIQVPTQRDNGTVSARVGPGL